MTIAIRQKVIVEPDGRIEIRSPELDPGVVADVIILLDAKPDSITQPMTASALNRSGLVGLWKDRKDIGDSLTFARKLRRQAEQRTKRPHDPA